MSKAVKVLLVISTIGLIVMFISLIDMLITKG